MSEDGVSAARLQLIADAIDALDGAGNVFQGLGAAIERMRRCKPKSK